MPITGIGQHAAEARAGSNDVTDLLDRELGLVRYFCKAADTPDLSMRAVSLVQFSGGTGSNLNMRGTSLEDSVTETNL